MNLCIILSASHGYITGMNDLVSPGSLSQPPHTHTLSGDTTGVVYKAVAEDEDLGLTCPLGPGRNIRCPCATTHYTIHHHLFRIHTTSGQVFVRTGVHLVPGERYRALIVAASESL
ncbi:hypothetical protein Pmani_025882 [Petrolisthes manimaculis]|uniref:Uncharacterized protein n=1 Tax=Petrolisthes manimaculis TaxID=1843537 RepID=A0AAE1TXZ1_9EUCA|nr:hypothetical protein Pmani_025882 [Petrolisthes manimaculis]